MPKEFKSLDDLKNEIKLTTVIEFDKIFLLKEAKKEIESKGIVTIERLFASQEKAQFLVENGSMDKFDEEVSLAKTYKSKPKEEKALHHFFKVKFKSEKDKNEFLKKNKENKSIKSFSDDQIMHVNATPVPVPNDQEYNTLWGLEKIKARDVWDCSKGCNTIVAVIDTGVDYNHDDINNNMYEYHPIVKGLNFTTDNGNDFLDPLDGNRHGTHVAGTIAAEHNNLFGVTGVAPSSKIFGVKALYNFGSGFLSDLTAAINWASWSIFNVDVINNSWGSGVPNSAYSPMQAAINYAISIPKITLVFAAGNSNMDANLFFPQNHPDVIVVGATDSSDNKANLSNYGSKLDVCAPGVQINSLVQGNQTNILSGTSMAAPHVSGMVALIKSKYPNIDLATIRKIVRTYVAPYNSSVYLGTGRISLENLEEILCGCGCSPCKLNQIIQARDLENKRLRKFKQINSLNCEGQNNEECLPLEISNFKPCFSFHWGDSTQDNIETHDTEICYLRVCNNLKNVNYKGLTISEIIITPNQVLPNGDRSVRMVPEELICFGNLGPCSCATREVAFLTRSAAPGNYTIKVKYCAENVELLGNNQFEDNLQITLINS